MPSRPDWRPFTYETLGWWSDYDLGFLASCGISPN